MPGEQAKRSSMTSHGREEVAMARDEQLRDEIELIDAADCTDEELAGDDRQPVA